MKTKFNILLLLAFFALFQISSSYKKKTDKEVYNEQINKETSDGYSTVYNSYDKNFEAAKRSLYKAKNDKERAESYFQMGDAMSKMMKYFDAIKYLQKADYYAEKSNSSSRRFMVNTLLSKAYSNIGLTFQAENSWKTALEISKKLNNPEAKYVLYNLKANNLEREKRFCEAIQYKTLTYEYNKKGAQKGHAKNLQYDYQASCSVLAYYHLKCGNFLAAKVFIEEFEETYNPLTDFDKNYLLEFYYLDKAIIFAKENKNKDAREWFDKAIKRAKSFNNKGTLITIIKERLLHNIGDSRSDKKHFEEYLNLHSQIKKESSLAYEAEFKKQEKNIEKQNSNIQVLFVISLGLTSLMFLVFYFNNKRKKQIKLQFEDIIKKIEQQNSKNTSELTKMYINEIQKDEEKDDPEELQKKKIISDSKEAELLEKLLEFESGTEFTSKNFTISNLASILDTNTKYTNYILKTHRGKNFNAYINELKINFVMNLLYKNPEYLNYKINYLSDLAGFSSHSRFTYIFRQELKIPPSEFINQLREKNKKRQ